MRSSKAVPLAVAGAETVVVPAPASGSVVSVVVVDVGAVVAVTGGPPAWWEDPQPEATAIAASVADVSPRLRMRRA